jgi:iron complex transport system substrate-binding protein
MRTTCLTFLFLCLLLITGLKANTAEAPKRIISLSPNITQIIYALGAWENVVGVTIYSDYPPEAKDMAKVGGWVNPNMEAILALKPDLVVLMKDQDTIFGRKLDTLGLKKFVIDSNESVSDILGSISALGEVLGREREAGVLVKDLRTSLDRITEATKDAEKKSVLIVVGRNPGTLEDIYVIGRDNYMNELLNMAGGENVIENKRLSIKLTKEAILTLDPDVIIEINHDQSQRESQILETWDELNLAKAVRDNQVYILPSTVLLHPSQRIVEGASVLTQILHPELEDTHGKNN